MWTEDVNVLMVALCRVGSLGLQFGDGTQYFQEGVHISNSRFFYKLGEIGNNVNVDIRGFTMWKQKIPVKNFYSRWVLNPWTSDSKSKVSKVAQYTL